MPVSLGMAPARQGNGVATRPGLDLNQLLGGTGAFGVDLIGDGLLTFMTDNPAGTTVVGPAPGDFYAGDFSGAEVRRELAGRVLVEATFSGTYTLNQRLLDAGI